jgi:hypothetical protein
MFNKLDSKLILVFLGGLITSKLSYNMVLILCLSIVLIVISFGIIELLISFENFESNEVKILSVSHDKNVRCLNITISNPHILEGEELFKSLYNCLLTSEDFINFSYQKIIILSAGLITGKEYNLHSNILINNDTKFSNYYLHVEKELSNYSNLQYGYNNETITRFIFKVWNADKLTNLKIKQTHSAIQSKQYESMIKSRYFRIHKKHVQGNVRSFSTSAIQNKHWSAGQITPLSLVNKNGILKLKHPKPFYTMDIETINFNNTQIPVAISSCGFNKGKIDKKLFLIDNYLLQKNSEIALKDLWSKYFTYLESLTNSITGKKLTIFTHNLGDFDGYFLYKGLLNYYSPETITSIIDDSNSFISIKHKNQYSIEWKDSLRIFPISLNKLCTTPLPLGTGAWSRWKINSIQY